jgi:hypothetical protein
VLLTKKPYSTWREIQDEFADYMTSLGPWPVADVLQFLHDEYPADAGPEEAERINRFMSSTEETFLLFQPQQSHG